ncbi:MATE family efflux transporter [bacterium]|nr:MATE family efflux transporter [bacterium]
MAVTSSETVNDTAATLQTDSTDAELLRHIRRLAGPVLIQQALMYLVGVSDTLITGRYLTSDDVAAVTIATYISWFLSGLMAVITSGSMAIVSNRVGAGDYAEANRTTGLSIFLALAMGFFVQVFGLSTAGAIVTGMNMSGPSAEAASIYFRVVVAAGPLIALRIVGNACMAAAGDTRTGSLIMVVVNAINVFLSYALVVGLGGLPMLGITGVALGTAIGESVGGVLSVVALIRGRAGLRLRAVNLVPERTRLARIVRISLPTLGETSAGILGQVWFLALVNRLGAISTAAHGVAIKCESISYLMVGGFASPAGILAGQYLGANRPEMAKKASNYCWALGNLLLAAMGILLFFANEPMFRIFLGSGKPELIAEGAPMLPVVAFAMPGLATINVISAVFRGAGATRLPFYSAMMGLFLLRIPITYLLANPEDGSWLGWGLKGAWIAMLVDLNLRGLWLGVQFWRGKWMKSKV